MNKIDNLKEQVKNLKSLRSQLNNNFLIQKLIAFDSDSQLKHIVYLNMVNKLIAFNQVKLKDLIFNKEVVLKWWVQEEIILLRGKWV